MGHSSLFGEGWLQMQQKFWQQLAAGQGAAAASDRSSAADPWQPVLDQWWESLQPTTPLLVRELLEKMLAQGRQLFQLAEMFTRSGQSEDADFDWNSAIQTTFADLRSIIAGITGSMNPVPQALLSEQLVENSEAYFKKLFTFPGFGMGHRSQAQQREMVVRMLAYLKARQAYEQLFAELGEKAVTRLQQRVAELESKGERIESAQQLYALWSSNCESVYAEQVISDTYVRLYAELINSQMAVKQQMRLMMDDAFRALGMPTTQDFRDLERRSHEDRRSIKALQAMLVVERVPAGGDAPVGKARPETRASSKRGG